MSVNMLNHCWCLISTSHHLLFYHLLYCSTKGSYSSATTTRQTHMHASNFIKQLQHHPLLLVFIITSTISIFFFSNLSLSLSTISVFKYKFVSSSRKIEWSISLAQPQPPTVSLVLKVLKPSTLAVFMNSSSFTSIWGWWPTKGWSLFVSLTVFWSIYSVLNRKHLYPIKRIEAIPET